MNDHNYTQWFINSYCDAYENYWVNGDPEIKKENIMQVVVDQGYQNYHNVKFIYDKDPYEKEILFVEFKNKSVALEFILRWS